MKKKLNTIGLEKIYEIFRSCCLIAVFPFFTLNCNVQKELSLESISSLYYKETNDELFPGHILGNELMEIDLNIKKGNVIEGVVKESSTGDTLPNVFIYEGVMLDNGNIKLIKELGATDEMGRYSFKLKESNVDYIIFFGLSYVPEIYKVELDQK